MSSSEARDLASEAAVAVVPGALLREAREAQGLAVADVARQLKLSVNQVEALEAGEFERLPGAVFVRGFVRNYARLLKLDVDSLLAAVAMRLPREKPRPAAPPSQDIPFPGPRPRPWRWYAAGLATLVVALAAYEFFPADGPGVPRVANESAAPAASAAQASSTAEPLALPPAPAAAEGGQARLQPAESMPAAPPSAAASESSPDHGRNAGREDGAAPAPGERQVRLLFSAESWVEIRDRSGRPIFSRLNRPGTEQRVSGQPPLSVVVGNARGVRLTYDDRPVNLAEHTRVDVARLTLE